jgi:ribosomal protein S18 acetylase RimI-like enzyme
MARMLRPLALPDFEQLPLGCRSCAFWESAGERKRKCGSVCDPELQEAWYRQVSDEWGACGRVAHEDDEVLGFIKYAPSKYFPQASTFASAPQDPTVPLISCLHIAPDARHHGLGSLLLHAALKDLIGRGERKVEAFASAHRPEVIDESPVMGVDFLLRNGFSIVRPDPHFPLMRLDLRSIVSWTENLEAVLNSLRFPTRVPSRAPASWTDGSR